MNAIQICTEKQKKKIPKSKNIHAKLRKNAIFGKSIENLMHKAHVKIWPQENNSDHLDQPLKKKDNLLMEQQLAKKKNIFRFK